jgi:hypothetical protein
LPEVAPPATVEESSLWVALLFDQSGPLLTLTLLSFGAVWKFVPEMLTTVPAGAISGVNPVTVGATSAATVKALLLVADPEAVVTLIAPVVALCGTTTPKRVVAAEVTVAATPLNRTVFSAGIGLNPVP